MKIKAFITHKLDERYADCADSFAVNPDCKRIAVSDGVSQSFSPQDWAKLLVNAFVDKAYTPTENDEQLVYLQDTWRKIVIQNLNKLEEAGEVTWMMENCIVDKESAGATFCGVELKDDQFHCWVLGDSALVTVSKNLEYTLYSTQDGEFNNRPDFLDSYGAHVGTFKKHIIEKDNLAYILLVTDPFSDLLYQHKNRETAKGLIERLLAIESHEEFCVMVDDLRANYSMHNDDSTFVSIQIDDSDDLQILTSTDFEGLIKKEALEKTTEEATESEEEQKNDEEAEVKPFDVRAILKGAAEKRNVSPAPETTVTPVSESEPEQESEQEAKFREEQEPELVATETSTEEPEPQAISSDEAAKVDSEIRLSFTYKEFLAYSSEAFAAMCDNLESKPWFQRHACNKLSSTEFEELWLVIADKLFKK